jgi:alanine-synthesizing transaminase
VSKGIPRLRARSATGIARYGVEFDPETEAISTIGSKEGIAHLALATLGRGDTVLVPNPSYPIHIYGPVIAGADIRHVPNVAGRRFLRRARADDPYELPKPKMLIINFPSNPTAQCVELPFFEKIVALAREHGIWVVHDLAYADITFDGWKAPSIMQVEARATSRSSSSRCRRATTWRAGASASWSATSTSCNALARIKGYHDYGTFTPIQVAAIAALEGPQDCVTEIAMRYQKRRDVLVKGLHEGRLEGRRSEGIDVCVGEDPGALPRCGIARIHQAAPRTREGLRVARHRLRRVRPMSSSASR